MNTEVLERPSCAGAQSARAHAQQLVALAPGDVGRRIGVELEFSNLSVMKAAEVTASLFGGVIQLRDRHHAEVTETALGSFTATLDTSITDKIATDGETLAHARAWFGDLASLVVPVEIACPPIPAQRLSEVERLVDALRRAGATGSNRSIFYAFGTHLNVEAPDADVDAVLRTLRAYVLLETWLRAQIDVNPARSAAGFEKSFPRGYQRLVLDGSYAPSEHEFIADYLHFSRSRNRGLDLLPILAHFDADAVREAAPREPVSPRPAYHYRLPNSEVDDPCWSVRREYRRWTMVERLAADEARLETAMAERLEHLNIAISDLIRRSSEARHALSLGAEMTGVATGARLR